MNQEGWGFKEFILIFAVIMFLIIITFIIYAVSFKPEKVTSSVEIKKNISLTYEDLENTLKRGAQRYQNDNYSGNSESDETWILTYEMLREKGYIKDKLLDPNDNSECGGYVRFIKRGASIKYIPYLKCGDNYKSEGYDLNYAG